MELVLTAQEIEPLPRQKKVAFEFKNEGLLNSNYKQGITGNFFNSSPKSIFGTKQSIKSKRYQITSSIETILKLSVFTTVLLIILL
ncbi:hypothetical protein D7030_11055 [Flavobacteriaceae bacterium AU392]|nr:hypothetical protein D1817_13615 [Flavobacteriaceae bacterium]RKM82698.1 hypothetical protein D7030_11055 [Flavobacteriaceae bacterium AU392]